MPLASPISWRPDPELRLKLERVRATFPTQRWSEVFVWLFEDPEIREKLRERAES